MAQSRLERTRRVVYVGENMMHQSDSVPVRGPRQFRTSTVVLVLIVGLVVGLVLGLIGGFLLGVVSLKAESSIRTSSYKVACSNNLRQLGIASQLYMNEYGTFPLASDETDLATDESTPPALSRAHLQGLLNSGMLDDPDVVICPGSEDRPATKNANGTFTLTSDSRSYLWAQELLTDRSPGTAPLAACRDKSHPRGRNLLFVDGSVKWVTKEEFEKSFRKYFNTA